MGTQTVEQETKALLRRVSTATLTTQLLKRGYRNTFLYGPQPLNVPTRRFVGEAFTLRYIPAREDLDVVEAFEVPSHPQRRAIEETPPGHVLVMDCRGQGRAASAGEILVTRLMRRGVAALVTDGTLRDSPSIKEMEFPAYCAGVSPMTNLAQHHAVDLQVPIACGGVAVYPGDVLVGDSEGVVCIPRHLAAEIATAAFEQEELEEFLHEKIKAGAGLPGVYPPNEATMDEYRAHGRETQLRGTEDE